MNALRIWVGGPEALVREFQEQLPDASFSDPAEAELLVVLDLEPQELWAHWRELPPTKATRLVNSTTVLALELALAAPHPDRVVGLHALPGLLSLERWELVRTEITEASAVAQVEALCRRVGKTAEWVLDRIGGVLPRLLCGLINEACTAVQEQVAGPEEIDLAMQLGTNYPKGPFGWMRQFGARNALLVLEALFEDLREPRYRASPVLRRYALLERLGLPLWGADRGSQSGP
ncbi:MAG: 3-hydroxyacyl-CoA dehydrogenase family protein [Bacteroidetes bacterium]|nr:3-hydroxyacyl-CoA dehydrogenase family protein [Bacteroidota bacterium]